MGTQIFPQTLPGPSLSSITSSERRSLSDVSGGPRQATNRQRDYLALQRVEWSLLSPLEADTFRQWYDDILVFGGGWFNSTWPSPQGWVSLTRRFMGAPQWTALPNGFWSISAQVQVRGRGMDPRASVTYYTSRPYALILGESMDTGFELRSGTLMGVIPDSFDSSFTFLTGTLTDILKSYTMQTEELDSSFTIVSGVLTDILVEYAVSAEPIDTSFTMISGTLVEALVPYNNWPTEEIQTAFFFLSGTLV